MEVYEAQRALTFALDFEGSLEATVAAGMSRPVRVFGKPRFEAGRRGRALLIGDGFAAQYRAEENLEFRRGTVAFWARRIRIPSPPRGLLPFWLTPYSKRGYLGVEVYSFPDGPKIFFWLHGFEGVPNLGLVGPKVDRWEGWHHLAVSWWRAVWRLYIDGKFWAECRLPRPLEPGEFPEVFQIGPEGRGEWRWLLDEFRIYDRPLTEAEIGALAEG